MLRGSSQARTIRSRGTGSGWLARKRSTRSVRVAAGTWLMAASCHRRRAGGRTRIGRGSDRAAAGARAVGAVRAGGARAVVPGSVVVPVVVPGSATGVPVEGVVGE